MLVESIEECEVPYFLPGTRNFLCRQGKHTSPTVFIQLVLITRRALLLSVVAPLALSHATASCSCQ